MVTLSLLSLCLLSLLGVKGEVASNFDNCKGFFFKNTPVSGLTNIALPTPLKPNTGVLKNPAQCLSAYNAASPAYICQRNGNQYYFATLYDRVRRIPLYSAYEMDIEGVPDRPGEKWYYEPQLVHPGLTSNQMDIKGSKSEIKEYNKNNGCKESSPQYQLKYKLEWSQALDDNFGKYDRGHLNPAGHHGNQDAAKATMTLTNIAPQNGTMNNEQWNEYEKKLKKVLSADCIKMYVVTGVVPSDTWVDQNRRVNVPSHYWNAYCCTDFKGNPLKSGGALGPNTAHDVITEYNSVTDLENDLREPLGVNNNLKIFNDC